MRDPLKIDVDGGVATITLDRPEAGNAIDVPMAQALLAAALALDANDEVRAVILTGAGAMFCAGGDIKAFGEAGDPAALIEQITAPLHMAIARLARLGKPLIVAVNGAAAGAGFGLAILGDVVLAARSARFAVAYGALGVSPDAGTSWLLPRLVGLRQAQRLALAGERIDAEEAQRIGLITLMVDDELLMSEAQAAAARCAAGSLPAFQQTRSLLHASFSNGLETQLEREAQAIAASARGPDGREGIAAFIAKRKASFGGA